MEEHSSGVWFFLSFFIFRSSLEGVYLCATLKITKWHLLTWSQLCLSPSHSNHSPTLLTLSRWGRWSLNTRVGETRLIEKGNLDIGVTTHSAGCSVTGRSLLDKWVWSDTLPLLSLIRVHAPEVREKTHLLLRRVYHKIPQALLALNYQRGYLGPEEELSTQWLVICQNGSFISSSWPLFNSV